MRTGGRTVLAFFSGQRFAFAVSCVVCEVAQGRHKVGTRSLSRALTCVGEPPMQRPLIHQSSEQTHLHMNTCRSAAQVKGCKLKYCLAYSCATPYKNIL